MQAIAYDRYGPPEVLRVASVAQPQPQAGELLVAVRAAAVSAADSVARRGTPFIARLAFGLLRPKMRILGTEFSGVVQSVGAGVSRFKPGDRVFAATGTGFGAHAEYVRLPEHGAVSLLPGSLGFADAAAVAEGGLTALPFLRDEAGLQPGQHVLINGAVGSVGSTAVQLAKQMSARVTAVVSTTKQELAGSLGADEVIDYTAQDFTKGPAAYDVVFDAVGKSSFGRCKPVIKPGGIYLTTVLGLGILWQMAWTAKLGAMRAKLALTGLRDEQAKAKDLAYLGELAAAGKLKPVIGQRFPLEQAIEAHRLVDSGHKTGHTLLIPGPAA